MSTYSKGHRTDFGSEKLRGVQVKMDVAPCVREQHGVAITSLLKYNEVSATAIAHHHSTIKFDFYLTRRHDLGLTVPLQKIINYTHLSHQPNLGKYTTSHVPTHLGRSSEQEDIPKPPTNRPLHSRSRRNSTNLPSTTSHNGLKNPTRAFRQEALPLLQHRRRTRPVRLPIPANNHISGVRKYCFHCILACLLRCPVPKKIALKQ